ncbi:hypothetical protein Ahy_B09g098384 [Arachis hypogaea]|uniref:Uncharacterized protein n=1 Tax=Arachis hypogaea TaxID=3818 RepID=A0A444XRQ2_ARAHY|nr:hypothetical protein Ahy_B09g098384 [Arachis hypogaea]
MCFNVDSYIADYYKKAAYISCYQHVVFPVNGPNLWDRTQFEDVLPPIYRKPIGRPKKKRARAAYEHTTRIGLSREGQQQKYSYCFCSGHNKRSCLKKRKVTPNPTINNVANSTSKGRSQRGVRKSARLSAKTASNKATESGSRKQKGNNNKPPSHPKRKPAVSSQQSQAASKRDKVDHSQTASAPAPITPRVLPSPVKRVTQSQLRFMARTPPRAWKNMDPRTSIPDSLPLMKSQALASPHSNNLFSVDGLGCCFDPKRCYYAPPGSPAKPWSQQRLQQRR